MSESILHALMQYAAQLIAVFGGISPILGGIATIVIAFLIAYFSIKAKKEKVADQDKKSGETIGDQTGKDQGTVGEVQDKLDDFLK